MKNVRKGKRITFRISLLTDGQQLPLEGRDITLEVQDPCGRVTALPVNVSGAILSADFLPEQQRSLGPHIITIWENKGQPNQVPVDIVPAVNLVRYTTEEGGEDAANLETETVDLGIADIGTADITDLLFAVEEVADVADTDYLVIRTAEGVRKVSAKALRDYYNYGLTIKVK